MNGAEVLTRFTADTSGVDKATKNTSASLGKLATAFTIGNVAASAINKTLQIFNQNLDGAITRYDTMNNFPKVMKNLGISADEANEVIGDLSEKLTGLPTSLDAGARAVQRFTAANGDIKQSEKIFLAVNNAILAGGASADIQASALEQMAQAYSKGKPDMMEWRTLMTAMPAQIKQVASAMGMTADQLGSGLRDGSISMDSFMNTIIKLNETGVGEFASFEEQARGSTQGISTSIKNMKTATIRGITTMIGKINESLAPFGGLSGVIGSLGGVAEMVFSSLGEGIAMIMPSLISLFQTIMPSLQSLVSNVMPILLNIFNALVPAIMAIVNALLPPLVEIVSKILPPLLKLIEPIIGLIEPILALLQPIIDAIMTLLDPLIELIDLILPPIIDLINVLAQDVLPAFQGSFEVAGQIISGTFKGALETIKPIIEGIKTILKGVTNFVSGVFTGNWKKAWEGVKSIFSGIANSLGAIFKAPINFMIDLINGFIKGLNKIQIPDWVPGVGGKGFHIKEIPKLNVGTNYVPQDTLAMVHKGEAVIPKKFNPYANGLDNSTIGNMQASKQNIIVNVEANFETDPLGQVVRNIKTFSGGAKNDYNYGMGGSRLA